MRRFTLATAGLLALSVATAAVAGETNATLADQTDVAVTIYNQDLALVRDARTISLVKGENDVAFVDVSAQIRPQTALLKSSAGPLDVLEQNFDFDLLTPEKLLEKSVGSMVRVIRLDPDSGDEVVQEARVLSVANGVVLQIGDRIETNVPGRIVFSEVPANLRSRPTLVTKLDSAMEGRVPVELAYLTGGLGWSADYIAELSPDESTIELKGWVTLTNTSGTAYRNAKLQLVAGNVNQVRQAMDMQMKAATMVAEAPAQPMTEQAMFEYHLYTLARPTNIDENQTKQVELLTGHGVPVHKEYRFDNVVNSFNARYGEGERVNADVRLMFENTEAAKLGIPLPKGIVRVYKADSNGNAIFVGEDAIDHTPKNESVKLVLGQAFDVTARGKQTDFSVIADDVFESGYSIEFKNAKTEPVTVTMSQNFPGDWQVTAESAQHVKADASTANWSVAIPAEGSTTLTYKVRVKY
ncbi:MAG TPA: DUF4139 domain-containing protein [Verrucomicrobiae bacterium]|nr:DUF4139 domain-containing protein [Verrucomicrobiae bacterium]